jgi:hypothetical protein
MALTRVTSGGIAPGVEIKFNAQNEPQMTGNLPAVSFNGDTDTGMYQSAANEISFATAGIKRFTIAADGKLKTYRDATDTAGSIVGGTNPDFDNATNIMLYVNQSDLNANDSISNTGGNVNNPFKTIERALLEAARRSYVADTGSSNPGAGGDHENDRFEAYTIMVMPGDYTVDNRPGVIGTSNLTFSTFENELYKFNPKNGGIVVPRGTSVIGYDLRKTVIRPKFVPNPSSTLGADTGDQVGAAYQSNSTTIDAAHMIEKARGYIVEQAFLAADAQFPSVLKINSTCQRDIGLVVDAWIADLREGGNENTFIAGERYTNGVALQHVTGTNEKTATLWAIDYAMTVAIKAAHAFGSGYTHTSLSGSTVAKPTYTVGVEYQSSGDCSSIDTGLAALGGAVSGPSTVSADGVFAIILNNPDTYTTLVEKTPGVYERTAIFKVTGGCYFWQMTFKDAKTAPANGVTYSSGIPTFATAANAAYSHHRVVSFTYADQRTADGELATYYQKIDQWDTTLDGGNTRKARREEFEIVGDRSLSTTIDTVNGCSPYIFNCSLRSVFGLCGMHTDGSKVSEKSFKSMVVAQFTGISLQRDNNAFWQPKDPEGDPNNTTYNDPTGTSNPPIYADPDAQYRPSWRHFHIKATDGAFIQVVSVFAVGYADQFLSESGGDMSITNSNSNFGQISLRAKGSQAQSFAPAAQGKITAIIPPRGISSVESTAEFYAIDYNTTWQKNGITDKNYNAGYVASFVSNINKFRLYLDIGGLNSEKDIPELIVDAYDHTTNSTVTKRFLNFGSNNNYNLFRDYYSTTGVSPASEAQIQTVVETEDGGVTNYKARLAITGITTAEITGENAERQGYFWDAAVNRIYVNVDASDAATDAFLTNFIFATTTEAVFTTTEQTNPDGSISIITGTSDITVLQYFDGFPSTLTTSKYIDSRAASPSDLLWRVEYTIPKASQTIPKPPEKRFIIKGTRLDNDGTGMPYTDFRFQVYDVEEITAWEYNVRDGVYYLTVIRSDVNTFMYGTTNNSETITRRPLENSSASFTINVVEGLNLFDKNTRVSSNINYLYPSVNEEGPTYDIRRIWNPPQSDSRVLVEAIGSGKRVKDLSVPNASFFYSGTAATPFKEVPSMTSVTAEACHRLVQSLDLSYAGATASANVTPIIAPIVSWDARDGYSDHTTSNVDIYGTGSFRRGGNGLLSGISSTVSQNIFGIDGEPNERRIVVVEKNKSYTAPSETNTVSITNASPTIPLFRPSILRASSHTWEYVGLGSGNYSTGFPNLQTRVLKPYEQFIAQGYENAGGFVASSGTNSNGDFYIGSQVVQAGGTSTITLNVPKVRKSSESNYVDITNLENRISNAVVNVTATTAKNSAGQSALKALSNFFNTAKLSVTDRATIQNLIVNERLYIASTRIANGEKFPEANQEAFGFVKGARPEKTGYISTDTNDRLYVSPKFLDAWRIKRQLISASNVTLDNNRIYVQPLSRTLMDNSLSQSTALTTASTSVKVKESAGIPSFGIVDVSMKLKYVESNDFRTVGSTNTYLNPEILVSLYYTKIDYTTNIITLNSTQNYKNRQEYLEDILGTSGYTSIIKHWSNPIDDGASASEKDIKYLRSSITSNVDVNSIGNPTPASPQTISIIGQDWANFPDRGAVTLREKPVGGTFRYSTYVYVKSSSAGNLILLRKVANASANDTGHTYTTSYNNGLAGVTSKNVFFAGCTTTVSFYDRWAKEEPFIPSVESISEDVDLESATLYTVPEKVDAYTGDIDESFVDNSLPNPFSAKALGVNLQNRQAVKKFSPLATFAQAQTWCEISGFGVQDNVELLLKPGYYKLDGANFPCQLTINGTGLSKSNIYAGKEQTGTSAGRMGGYLESTIKRGDSIYLYRAPSFRDQYGRNSDSFNSSVTGGLTSTGGFNLNNLHFLGLNDAITKNEILDETYSTDTKTSNSRKLVRKAWYIKTSDGFPASEKAVAGGLLFTGKQSGTGTGKVKLDPYIHSDDFLLAKLDTAASLTGSGDDCSFNPGGTNFPGTDLDLAQNARYMTITLDAAQFTGTSGAVPDYKRFIWARNYIIPGTTMYWLQNTSNNVTNGTPSTKVLNVRYVNRTVEEDPTEWATGANSEKIIILVSVYRPVGTNENGGNAASFTNTTEDLDLLGLGYVNSTDANMVFVNRDGDEFTTLAYNWCISRRRELLPKGFAWAGGYQGAIIKTVPSQAASGVSVLTLNDTTSLNSGDVIFGPGIASGTTITVNSSTELALSDATTAIITANTKVSFTQSDDFGNVIDKFDTPEVFGIINGYDRGTVNLVIDLNPSSDIDSTIKPYPFTDFNSYVAVLLQLRTDTNEDGGVTLPYKFNGFKRITGTTSSRFVLLQVNPGELYSSGDSQNAVENPDGNSESFIDNRGINSGIMGRFGGFTPFSLGAAGGVGTGATFSSGQVAFSSASSTSLIKSALDSALSSGGSGYNGRAKITLIPVGSATGTGAIISVNRTDGVITSFNVSGSITTYNGTFTATIADGKGFIDVNGSTVNTSTTSFSNDEQFIAVAKSNLLAPVCPYLDSGTTRENAIGKNIYLSWPNNHRALRKRFKAASLPCTGNFCSPVINVDAIPGSNVPLSLNNCTIGGMSPSTTQANTFGGGYAGGLIRARGSQLSLSGLRVRGNLSLDWTGLMYTGSSRAGGSFTYGHSVELLQMEDDNSLQALGGTNARRLGVARDDEDFQRVSGFNSDQTLFLEPSKTPYGELSDADSRTFPISSYQAIRRFNQGGSVTFPQVNDSDGSQIFQAVTIPAGGLLTRTEINERFLTPKPIRYNNLNTNYTSGDASAFRLRWNNSGSTVSNGSSVGGSILSKELTFLYPVADAEFVKNIFVGAFASKIVKTTNISTSYATVTNVTLPNTAYNAAGSATGGGAYRLAKIRYSGSIPLSVAEGSNLLFLTSYLTTNRYKYTTTTTSRYAKVNYQGHSNLNLIESGTQYEIHSEIKVEKTGTPTTNLTRSSIVYLHSGRTGSTPGQAYLTTNGSGNITTLDFITYGSGHLESDQFTIRSTSSTGSSVVTSGITLTAVRNLTDNIEMFEPGEMMGVLPTNCFILNSINNPSVANLVTALKKAKTLFKPGSYILYGGTYYKIAEDDQSYPNKPYMGVYKYANENNTADIRANIVIMLEDVEYTPTYPSNTRFDIFDNDNVLDYWPEKGKIMIGDLELCDFAKTGDPTSNTGYTITLQRDMEQYFPSYIRDWEGLDPLESLSQDVTVGGFTPTSLKLADPVDVTCTGLKRIRGTSADPIVNSVVTHPFIAPDGKYSTSVARINIKSDDDQTAAKEKLSIGQVVHLPYRDLSVNFSNSPNTTSSFKIGSPLGVAGSNVSTNRAGDLRLSGKFTSGDTKYFNYWYRFHIFNNSKTTGAIYNSVSALATCKMYWSPGGNNRLSGAGYYMTSNGIRFYGYRWYSLDGATVNSGSSDVVIGSGDTMYIQTVGTYTASLSNTGILTVTSVSDGGLFLGQSISGTGIPANAYISGYAGYSEPTGVSLSGRGGTGTYTVSVAGSLTTTNVASTTITGSKPASGQDYAVYYPGQTGYWQRRVTKKSYNASNGKTTLTFNSTTTNTFTGGSILMYYYGASEDNVVLSLDKALLNDAPSTPGSNEVQLGWNLSSSKSNSSACKIFKSRIIDIDEVGSFGGINLYLADPLPEQYTASANMRHYGFLFINYGGWTYPSQGGSSYRSNNAALGSNNTTMILPNRAGRIQPGDTIRYSYEDDVSDSDAQASPSVITYSGQVSSVAAVDSQGYSQITLSTSSNHILYSGHTHKQQWLSLGDIFVSHRTGNFVTNGPVMDKFIYSDTGLKMKFGQYRMWYENISNYINTTNGITGRAGWIGNFALSSTGEKVTGLGLNGASAIQWGRQYNTGVWLSAHPTTPRWVGWNGYYSSSSAFSNHMMQIQNGGSIESWMSNISTIPSYEGGGSENNSFYPINHSHLTCGSLYAGLNTSNSEFGYVGAYDVAQYQWSPSNTKLDIGLQDGVVDASNGEITSGGTGSRVTEGLIISRVQHYKPIGWPGQDGGVSFNINSFEPAGNITAATNSSTVTGSSTFFTRDILPGDQLYSEEGNDATPAWIGTVASVESDTSLTLRSNSNGATSGDGTWSVISSRVKKAGDNAPNASLIFSGNSQASGLSVTSGGVLSNRISNDFAVPGNNVIRANRSGYDRYNFAFRISKRTYNQTPLLNTRGEITPVSTPNDARKVMMPKMGDLSEFQGQIMNVDVTRLNAKTHIERSISVVGSQINI